MSFAVLHHLMRVLTYAALMLLLIAPLAARADDDDGDGYDDAEDCNDRDADTHPFAKELSNDDIDQNCDGQSDEPVLVYSTNIRLVTSDSVRLNMFSHKNYEADKDEEYYYKIRYFALRHSDHEFELSRKKLPAPSSHGDHYELTVDDLDDETVYAFKIIIQRKVDLSHHKTDDIITYLTDSETDWFYTTTDSDDDRGYQRTRFVLKALKEYGDSQKGEVGDQGSVDEDGTRYGASKNEKWCSEFYSWVTRDQLRMHADSVNDIASYFSLVGGYTVSYASAVSFPVADVDPEFVVDHAARGDYLATDTNDDGDIVANHSEMFLAWDEDDGKMWSVSGNTSVDGFNNRIVIKTHSLVYDDADDNNGNPAYRVVGVGDLDRVFDATL